MHKSLLIQLIMITYPKLCVPPPSQILLTDVWLVTDDDGTRLIVDFRPQEGATFDCTG